MLVPHISDTADVLLFMLLGPAKAAEVQARHRAVHLRNVKIPKPATVKRATDGFPTAPGMPMVQPYGPPVGTNPPPPAPASIQKVPGAPKVTQPAAPKPAAPAAAKAAHGPLVAAPGPATGVKRASPVKVKPGIKPPVPSAAELKHQGVIKTPPGTAPSVPVLPPPPPGLELLPDVPLGAPAPRPHVVPPVAPTAPGPVPANGPQGASGLVPSRRGALIAGGIGGTAAVLGGAGHTAPRAALEGVPEVAAPAGPGLVAPITAPGPFSTDVGFPASAVLNGVAGGAPETVPPVELPTEPTPGTEGVPAPADEPSWFGRNSGTVVPALLGGGLLAGGLLAHHARKKKRDEENDWFKPAADLATDKPFAPGGGAANPLNGDVVTSVDPGHMRSLFKPYGAPGYVDFTGTKAHGSVPEAKPDVPVVAPPAVAPVPRHVNTTAPAPRAVTETAPLPRTLMAPVAAQGTAHGSSVGTGAMPFEGHGVNPYGVGQVPAWEAQAETPIEGPVTAPPAAPEGPLNGIGQWLGDNRDWLLPAGLAGGGLLAGGLLAHQTRKKRRDPDGEEEDKEAADGVLGNIGEGDWGGALEAGKQQLNEHVIDPIAQRAGTVAAGSAREQLPFGKGVGDFLNNNRWAQYAMYGAPIGAGLGLVGGLFNRKKKRNALGDALTGGLLGAAGGGLLGASADLNREAPNPPVPAAAQPTPPPTAAAPRAADNPIVNPVRVAGIDAAGSAESNVGRRELGGLVQNYNAALGALNERGLAKLQPVRDYADAYTAGAKRLNAFTPLGEENWAGRLLNRGVASAGVPVSSPADRAAVNADLQGKFQGARNALAGLKPFAVPPEYQQTPSDPAAVLGHLTGAAGHLMTADQVPTGGAGGAFSRALETANQHAFNALNGTELTQPALLESNAALNPRTPFGRRALATAWTVGGLRATGRATGVSQAMGFGGNSIEGQAARLHAAGTGTAEQPGLVGRLLGRNKPIAADGAGEATYRRVADLMNRTAVPGTGLEPVSPTAVPGLIAKQDPRTMSALQAASKETPLTRAFDGSRVSGTELAQQPKFVDAVRTRAGLGAGPEDAAKVQRYLTRGTSGDPLVDASLESASRHVLTNTPAPEQVQNRTIRTKLDTVPAAQLGAELKKLNVNDADLIAMVNKARPGVNLPLGTPRKEIESYIDHMDGDTLRGAINRQFSAPTAHARPAPAIKNVDLQTPGFLRRLLGAPAVSVGVPPLPAPAPSFRTVPGAVKNTAFGIGSPLNPTNVLLGLAHAAGGRAVGAFPRDAVPQPTNR